VTGLGIVEDGRALVWRRKIGAGGDDLGQLLELRAETVRRERTGVHARLEVRCNNALLAWSNFNIERDEDRVRLGNSAYKHLDALKDVYPGTYLKSDLDKFCAELWTAFLDLSGPVMMGGTLVPRPPRFVLRPYILDGGGSILFAPPGRGKSYTLMLMMVCVDAGLDQIWPSEQRKVLFINLERSPGSVEDRLGAINQVLGLPRDRQILTLHARGRSLADVAEVAEEHIRQQHIELVFVDSISRAGAGDLNANDSSNRIIDILNRIAPTWLALAHTPRADESHVFGSIHFEAGADVVIQLLSEQEGRGPLGVGLQITKNNDIGPTSMGMLALEFSDTGLSVVRHARKGEFPEIERGRKLSLREQIREHLLDVGPQTATEIAEELGANRSNVGQILRTGTTFIRGAKLGKRQLYAVAGEFK